MDKFSATDHFWNDVAGTHETQRKSAALVHAKIASSTWWPFLAHSENESDFDNRLSLVSNKIEAAVGTDLYEEVSQSLRDDFRAVHEASRLSAQSTSPELADLNSGLGSHGGTLDHEIFDHKAGRWVTAKPHNQQKRDDYQPKHSTDGKPDEDEDEDSFEAHKFKSEATNYQPDPNAAWRYYAPYQNIEGAGNLNNGALQDADGFPIDLAQNEDAAAQQRMQFQLTPGQWTQHDGMPERPMPQGVARGYMPVNAAAKQLQTPEGPKQVVRRRPPVPNATVTEHDVDPDATDEGSVLYEGDKVHVYGQTKPEDDQDGNIWASVRHPQGHMHMISPDKLRMHGAKQSAREDHAGWDQGYYDTGRSHATQGQPPRMRGMEGSSRTAYIDGYNSGYPGKHREATLQVDAEGFLVTAYEGRGVDPLVDPVPGAAQRVNPYYFNPAGAMGANDGFPEDPGPEPLEDRANTYGDRPPVMSSGSETGTIDGNGYSRSHPGESPDFSQGGKTANFADDEAKQDWHRERPSKDSEGEYNHFPFAPHDDTWDLPLKPGHPGYMPADDDPWNEKKSSLHVAYDEHDRQSEADDARLDDFMEQQHDRGHHDDERDGDCWKCQQHEEDSKHTAGTNGQIVDHCPGCNEPRRVHSTMHGDEIRHLHNNHVRCHGSKTASDMGADDMGDPEESATPEDDSSMAATGSVLPQFFDPTLSSEGSFHTADYLGRPDTNNLEGRGDNAFDAFNWDKLREQRPVQSLDDMHPNSPGGDVRAQTNRAHDERGVPGNRAESGDDEAEDEED